MLSPFLASGQGYAKECGGRRLSLAPGGPLEESLWGTPLTCLATAGRRGKEAEEAQHDGRQPLPVLPKELADTSIFTAAGEMEAALALLPLAGNGGPPLATDVADLQKAQQLSHQGCALGPPRPASNLWQRCRDLGTAEPRAADAACGLQFLLIPEPLWNSWDLCFLGLAKTPGFPSHGAGSAHSGEASLHTLPYEVLTFLVACFTARRTSSGRMLWTS